MPMDLTTEAVSGYVAPTDAQCPFQASSPSWMAWHVGKWLNATGRPKPTDVRTSRGYRMRSGDMLLDVSDVEFIQRLQ